MIPDQLEFDDYEVISSSITIVNNGKCNIEDVENLKFPDLDVKIENICHIPDLGFNLMSMGYLRHQGFKIAYDYKGGYFAVKTPDGKPAFEARCGSDFVYRIQPTTACTAISDPPDQSDQISDPLMDPEPDTDVYTVALTDQSKIKARWDTMSNWHRRLGHLNAADIVKLSKDPRM